MTDDTKLACGQSEKLTRRERFARCVKNRVSARMIQRDALPVQAFEEIEKRNIFDLITDRLCLDHGIGVEKMDKQQRTKFVLDGIMEKDDPAKLAAYEKLVASVMVDNWLTKSPLLEQFSDDEIRSFFRAFYRHGDIGSANAERRALRFALDAHLRGRHAERASRSRGRYSWGV